MSLHASMGGVIVISNADKILLDHPEHQFDEQFSTDEILRSITEFLTDVEN